MIGHEPLVRMRLKRHRPAGYVSIDLDRATFNASDWLEFEPAFPKIEIKQADTIATLDLRFVVGLHVVLFADAWSERFGELIDAVKRYSPAHLVAHTFDLEEPILWPS